MNPADALPEDLAGESRFQLLTRLGFAGRGFLYIVIGLLVILAGRTEDLTGALEYLGHGLGKVLLVVLAAGLAVYGLWRLTDAAFGIESGRHHAKAHRKRIAAATSGVIYGFLSYKAVLILLSQRIGDHEPQQHASAALHLPGGEVFVWIASAILFGAAIAQFVKVRKCDFLRALDCDEHQKVWIKWLGRVGYSARGIIFFIIAWLLALAALHHRAAEAGGLEEALDAMHPAVRASVAAGLIVFGVLSLVEARFRRIHRPPPVDHVAEKVVEAVRG
ncbi:DUF1206 domain-containing protein [Sphingomonas daechungensis]|uniref:DUF1206 domain-containing protein n=1 Tax=Sphingomonas daechungensis TaxID=1176646 RepID=UPI00378460A3